MTSYLLISFYAHNESISDPFSEQPNPFKITDMNSMGVLCEIIGVFALCMSHVSPALTSQINPSDKNIPEKLNFLLLKGVFFFFGQCWKRLPILEEGGTDMKLVT